MLLFDYSTIIDPILKDVRICVAGLSGVKTGDRVLDVCCGTGEQVFHYTQKGAIATGVDQNLSMIELAETNRKRRGFKHSTFHLASATSCRSQTVTSTALPYHLGCTRWKEVSGIERFPR